MYTQPVRFFLLSALLAFVASIVQVETPVVRLTKLAPLNYMPLARQAHITRDVKVQVLIRKDGTVASATVISGDETLVRGAVENAPPIAV